MSSFDERWKCQRLPNRQVSIERVEKFIGATYWRDVNLRGKLYTGEKAELRSLTVFSTGELGRIPFAQAVQAGWGADASSPAREARIGESFGPSWSTHWFRLVVGIPAEWRAVGKEVHLLWDSSCEALIFSADGQPLQGLTGGSCDEARKEFILTRGGDSGDVEEQVFFVEIACNGMFGCGFNGDIFPPTADKSFALVQAEVAVFNRAAWDLIWDFDVLIGLAKDLPGGADNPRAAQALFVANEMINVCDVNDSSTWPAARELAQRFLGQRNGEGQCTVSCIGNTHIDTAWLWPYAETRRKCARSLASQLRLMEEFEFYRFACPQAVQLAWVKADYPSLFARLQAAAARGQFCPTGGCWVEMDCNIPSGESIVRQFYYGQKFFEQEFGSRCSVFWLPDTFGYNSQLPQLMLGAGMKYFLTQKLSWNLFNKLPSNTFVWQGLDGSEVLVHFPPADSYVCRVTVDEVVRSATRNRDADRSPNSYMLFGFGDGGGGPTAPMLERAARMRDLDGLPRLQPRSPSEFFDKLAADIVHPLKWVGELYFELHRGTFTTHASVKKNNRRTEVLLHSLEFLYAVAAQLQLVGYPHQSFDELWKLMLLQQFHDVLPGTSINLVYQDVHRHYAQIFEQAGILLDSVLAALVQSCAEQAPAAGTTHLAVCNTIGQPRTELVEHAGQTRVVTVPPFSMSVVEWPSEASSTATTAAAPSVCDLVAEENVADGVIIVRNSFFTATFNKQGQVISLCVRSVSSDGNDEDEDATESWEAIEQKSLHGNQFIVFDDVPLFWDAWCAEMYHVEKPVAMRSELTEPLHVVEQTSLRVVLRYKLKLSDVSTVVQDITITSVSRAIDFNTHVDWHENRKFLKVLFPVNVHSDHARYHVPFGWIQRPTHRNTSWDAAKFEVVGHFWADLSEYSRGVALLNDCKYGYAVLGNLMSLSLLRSTKYPDEFADEGEHTFRYSLFAHNANDLAPVVQLGNTMNYPLYTTPCGAPKSSQAALASLFSVASSLRSTKPSPAVILDTIKQCEADRDFVILRLYEALGSHATVFLKSQRFDIVSASLCNLLEDPGDELATENSAIGPLQFSPFQVQSLRVRLLPRSCLSVL